MLTKQSMFNSESLCIFTDASLISLNNITSVCSGVSIYVGNLLIDQQYTILHNATIQQGEWYGILMGVVEAVKYKDRFKYIRLFSDSLTSILALRERIFKWIQRVDLEGNLRGSDNNIISNQDYIMHIINMIITYEIHIEFYHVKGHIKCYDNSDIERAKDVFKKSNHITDLVDNELIRMVSIGNDQVDRYTGYMLYYHYEETYRDYVNAINAVSFSGYIPFNSAFYQHLIGG